MPEPMPEMLEAIEGLLGQAVRLTDKTDTDDPHDVDAKTQMAWFLSCCMETYVKERRVHPAAMIDATIVGLVTFLTTHSNKSVPYSTGMIVKIAKGRILNLFETLEEATDANDPSVQLAMSAMDMLLKGNPEMRAEILKKWGDKWGLKE